MMRATYWVQNGDYSMAVEDASASAETVARALSDHDFAAQRDEAARLGDAGCPPGLGIVRDDGAILHILPQAAGYGGYLHHLPDPTTQPEPRRGLSRLFARGPQFLELDFHHAPPAALEGAVEAFLSHRDASVVSLLKATP